MFSGVEFITVNPAQGVAVAEISCEVDHIIVLACGVEPAHRNIPMVPHAAKKDVFSIIETSGDRRCSVVPLSGDKCVVPMFFKHLWHGCMTGGDILPFPPANGTKYAP